MDYPISDTNARLNDGKFSDGDPVQAIPPSKDSAAYQNAVYDELLNVITEGDLTPDEAAFNQLFTAINNIAKSVVSSQTAGQVSTFPGTAVPDGWLKANGQTVSRTEYSYLWAYAQNSGNIAANEGAKTDGQFGPGDGLATFSLPDLRGVHVRNWDDGKSIDTARSIGSNQGDENKQHNHSASSASAGSHNHSASTASAGSHNHSASSASAGSHSHTYDVRRKNLNSGNVTAGNKTIAGGLADNYDDESYSVSNGGNHSHGVTVNSGGSHSHGVTVSNGGDHSHLVTVQNTGGDEVRVKNIALMACIKY